MLHGHDCDRFRAVGLQCPFRKFREDEDQPDDEEEEKKRSRDQELPEEKGTDIPFMFPARRSRIDLPKIRQLVVAHGDPEMAEALERMAAFKNTGGLPSIPNFPRMKSPLSEQSMAAIMAALTGIGVMQALRLMRQTGSNPNFQAVQASERHAAKGLSKVSNARGLGSARTSGRGGIHVNAAADLKRLLRPRSLSSGLSAGVDTFSETGFN